MPEANRLTMGKQFQVLDLVKEKDRTGQLNGYTDHQVAADISKQLGFLVTSRNILAIVREANIKWQRPNARQKGGVRADREKLQALEKKMERSLCDMWLRLDKIDKSTQRAMDDVHADIDWVSRRLTRIEKALDMEPEEAT